MGKFKDLRVWQEATELAIEVYKMTFDGQLEKDFALKDQIRRSAISIPSNIAEGDELGTNKQAINLFFHARGSAAELQTQLILAQKIGYIDLETLERLEARCEKIRAMLNKLISSRKD